MPKKLLVVVGLTGQQGGAVADLYTKEAGWTVRGITRNPDKAQSWVDKGVEVVKADLDDEESLVAAFQGAHAIFVVTDFWAHLSNPATPALLKPGQTINEYCYEKELQQGKNSADAAATIDGLERFIVSAVCNTKKWSKGKYTGIYHFDSKAEVVEYIQDKHPKLAAKMSVVQIGVYMNNWKMGLKPTKQADGSYRLAGVGSGKKPLPHFHTSKDTGYVVRAALQTPPGKNILAVGSMLSWADYLKVWCEVNKVPFGGYDEIPIDVFEKYIPVPGFGRELGEMFLFMDEFGYDGGDPSVVHAQDVG
ncbi:hypothetical protein MMC13_008160 [Lambiella insularis]|nr:hypothetical protein [Lambiella insularis]